LHGIFLAGAAHFKGYPFPKTLLTLVLFCALCGLITYLIMKDMFDFECTSESNPLVGMPVYSIWLAAEWLFWWILAPLCWVVTYMGLKEQEV
jgi:hypothetical protein